MRGRRGSVDREQRARDGGVRPAPAVQELCAVGDLVRERVPEGALTRKPAGREELGRRRAARATRRARLRADRPRRAAARRHVVARPPPRPGARPCRAARADRCATRGRPARSRAARSPRSGRPARTRRAPRGARRARRASERSPRRRGDCRWARASIRARSGASAGSGPSQSSSRVEASRGARGDRERCSTRRGPCRPVFGPRGRDHQDPAARPTPEPGAGREHLQRRGARRVEKVQVLDPEQQWARVEREPGSDRRVTGTDAHGAPGAPAPTAPARDRGPREARARRPAAIGSTVGTLARPRRDGISDFRSRGAVVDAEETRARARRPRGRAACARGRARGPGGAPHRGSARRARDTDGSCPRRALRDQDDLRSTGPRLVQGPLEQRELMLAADEAREAARA